MLHGMLAVISQDASDYRDALLSRGAEVLLLPPHGTLDTRVASHPDMLLAQLGDDVFLPADYAARPDVRAVTDTLTARCGIRIHPLPCPLGADYPADIAYNILTVGDCLYARTDRTAPGILSHASRMGYRVRSVRQGYAGCSSLACNTLVFSADPSVLRAVASDGFTAVPLAPDGISLSGYECGFIGGASGYLDGCAVFFGDLARHPSGAAILDTLRTHGIRAVSLGKRSLADFGGIRLFKLRQSSCVERKTVL